MRESINEVDVVLTNGDTLKVDAVGIVPGAEWVQAEIVEPTEAPDTGDYDLEWIILRADNIRYIRSDRKAAPNGIDANVRVHYTEGKDPAGVANELWRGQLQLQPDNGPSTHTEPK